MDSFLRASAVVDADHPSVIKQAISLSSGKAARVDVVRACFEFVRDEVRHSVDHRCGPVTCRASDVLAARTGYCYAKSHLLAALLRANGVPAGFCYQRLAVGEKGPPYCLHGLNAVYLDDWGWYRVDARGNKPGIAAVFTPPIERLAFRASIEGEREFPEIFREPLPVVVATLERHMRWDELADELPDIDPLSWPGPATPGSPM